MASRGFCRASSRALCLSSSQEGTFSKTMRNTLSREKQTHTHWSKLNHSSGCGRKSFVSLCSTAGLGPWEMLLRHLVSAHCIYIHIHLVHCSLLSQVQQSCVLSLLPRQRGVLLPLLVHSSFYIQVRQCERWATITTVWSLFPKGVHVWWYFHWKGADWCQNSQSVSSLISLS